MSLPAPAQALRISRGKGIGRARGHVEESSTNASGAEGELSSGVEGELSSGVTGELSHAEARVFLLNSKFDLR